MPPTATRFEPRFLRLLPSAILIAFLAGCSPGPVESADILEREPVTARAEVKHVLIAWSELAPAYGGRIDPRGAERTKEDADQLARQIVEKARSGENFEALMKDHSEDPGSALSGGSYPVTQDAALVPGFKKLSLRLQVDESGVVLSKYGWHVIKRVK